MIERDALRVVLAHKPAAFLFSFLLLAVAGAGAACLWIPDSTGFALAASAIAWLLCGSALLAWCALTIVFYQRAHSGVDVAIGPAVSATLKRLPVLWLWLAAAAVLVWIGMRWNAGVWVLLAAVPWLGAAAAKGLRGFREPNFVRLLPVLAVFGAIAYFAPGALWEFRPSLSGLTLEMLSLALRFLLAFTILMLAWLTCASAIGRLHAARA